MKGFIIAVTPGRSFVPESPSPASKRCAPPVSLSSRFPPHSRSLSPKPGRPSVQSAAKSA